VARKADVVLSVRADAYGRAVTSLMRYVSTAARDDKWLPLARVRLLQCAAERARFVRERKIHFAPQREVPGDPEARQRTFFEFAETLRGKSREEQQRLLDKWIREHGSW
jgi:hypothetical protein